jgi:PKD repeat protein
MENRTPKRSRCTVIAALLVLATASLAQARTLRTITIDGDLDDWTEVLLDRPQTTSDKSEAQGDPDVPGQAQRDLRGVAVTWDATNLYLYFSRTGSGTNSFNGIFYLDIGHDGLLEAADRVLFLRFSGSSFNGADLHEYVPLAPLGDPIPGDGIAPDGGKGTALSVTGIDGQGDPSGIRFEAVVPWARITATPQAPIFVRPALAANQNIPGSLEDNASAIDTFLPAVLLSDGRTRGAAPGRTSDFEHRVTNAGTGTDTIDLSTRSLLGFSVEIHSDPDGDGDPVDGALTARDANGDGDFTDAFDTPPSPVWDTNSNALPDGGPMAVDATRDWVIRVGVPAGQELDTEDTVRVAATSAYATSARDLTRDHLRVGLITVTPPGATIATSTLSARFAHEACNGSGIDRVLDVTAVSALGWPVTLTSDPNGDGDPADGVALADGDADGLVDLGLVADGDCAAFVASVVIPPGTPGSLTDDLSVLVSDDALTALAVDRIDTVGSRVSLTPDRSATGQRGKTLYLAHDLRNAANEDDSFTLSSSSVLGAEVAVLDDPDDDQRPDDSVVVTATGTVGADGGRFPLISRVRIPATAVHGDVDTVTVQAVSDASAVVDTAAETIDVAGLLTYSDPLFARPATEFYGQCSSVYALAFQDAGTFIFNWLDPGNGVQRISPELSPYADGSLDDFFDMSDNPPQGLWTLQLLLKQGSNWVTLGAEGTRTFEVVNLVDAGAAVSEVDTGSDLYDPSGEDFVGFAEVVNPSPADILGSMLTYVVFFDADGDGRPTAGEDWLRGDGTSGVWAPLDATFVRSNIDVFSGEAWADRFDVPNAGYSRIGGWTLHAAWTASCGFLVSELTAPFTVGCEPAPSFGGLVGAVDLDPCTAEGISLTWAAATDWGAGGSGSYAVWRSEDPGFVPSPATLLVSGVAGLSYLDVSAVEDVTYYYLVQAESDVICSTGPNNGGLLDGNLLRRSAVDSDAGEVPVASFSHSTPECWDRVAGVVSFQDLSSGPPAQWSWDFDDDGLEDASGPSPDFDFPGPGTYSVSLTVTNVCGQDSIVIPVTLTEAPIAAPVADRAQTCIGEGVDFDGSLSSPSGAASIVAWSWDFDGDGLEDSALEDPPPAVFVGQGAFAATLTVTDSEGCSDTASLPIVVHPELSSASLTVVQAEACTGDVSVRAVAAGGLPPYAFSWDVLTDDGTGLGSATFPLGSSFTATVTVTDAAGCSAQATTGLITLPSQLGVQLAAPTADPCTGEVSVSAQALGGTGPYSYAWDVLADDGLGNGSATFPLGTGGNATVTVTDGAGCVVQATSLSWTLPEALAPSFTPVVTYISPGVFDARALAAVSGGTGTRSFEWDLDDDGVIDGTGPSFSTPLAANQTRPLRLSVRDDNDCLVSVVHDLVSGGCPVDVPLSGLRVRKGAGGAGLVLTWDPSAHGCHGRYRVVEAASAEPATRPGTWLSDPVWSDLQAEDADGSDQDEQLLLADTRDGESRYFLVRDGGTDGSYAPTLHYGNLTPGP